MNRPDTPAPSRTRSRLQLLLVAAFFLGSFGIAASLFFGGWKPSQTRNIGEMLDPYPDLRGIELARADGSAWQWQPAERNWHVVFVAPQGCGEPCAAMYDALHRVWLSEGRHAERLKVLWFGEVPPDAATFSGLVPMQASPALAAALPDAASAQALPAYLADPNGYLVLRYAPGFNPASLRKDLGRVLK